MTCQDSPKFSTKSSQCSQETIQRGQTSIYIFDNHHEACADTVRNEITKHKDDDHEHSDETPEPFDDKKCSKTVKRSAKDEEETIVVVKKRGNKVFIEI